MAILEQEEDLHFTDIWAVVERHKRIIISAPIASGVVAYILAAFVIAPKWESSVILQVGQVGQVEQVGQAGQLVQGAKIVEPLANVIVRMQQPSFQAEVLDAVPIKPEEKSAAKVIYTNSLKVSRVKDAELIEVKLRGYSADMARSLAMGTVTYLQHVHDEIMETGVSHIKSQIENTDGAIRSLKEDISLLRKQLQGKRDWNSFNATLAATVLQDESNQLQALIQKRLLLTEQLSSSITFTTRPIGKITVSEAPVSPRKALIISLAIFLGLLGGVTAAFINNAISRNKAQA